MRSLRGSHYPASHTPGFRNLPAGGTAQQHDLLPSMPRSPAWLSVANRVHLVFFLRPPGPARREAVSMGGDRIPRRAKEYLIP